MQSQNSKLKILPLLSARGGWFLVCSSQLLVIICLYGCAVLEHFGPEKPPYDEQLSQTYYITKLKQSSSADVLPMIHKPAYELLSQSESVVASSGQKKKGRQIWFNMVAFDENRLTAIRKYFFMVDEKPKSLWVQPKRRLKFDTEMGLEPRVFAEPYANEDARRIAILRQVLKNISKDIGEVGGQDKRLSICGMLINQTLETILLKLDSSPVLASRLSTADGLDFDHITLGAGVIWMGVAGDTVNVRIRVDSFVRTYDDPFALED